MNLNYNTTWIGLMGGGISGSFGGGGSVYQLDVWNMGGGVRLPARVMITGWRAGLVAQLGTSHALLIVTGCSTAKEMEGATSTGLDWELAAIIKAGSIAKTGAKIFQQVAANVAADLANWALHESAKRLVQWAMDDLGVVKPGKQFNLLPTPLGVGVGAGIFYEWQTLHLLSGNVGWQHFSPKWNMEVVKGNVRLQLYNIPEQDGEKVRIGLSIPEWGADPYIRWKKKTGEAHIDGKYDYHIVGYVYDGFFFENRNGYGYAGINLTNLQPIGRLSESNLNFLSAPPRTNEVKKGGKLKVSPVVFSSANLKYWAADETIEMTLDSDGCFVDANNGMKERS